jgi:hypothetical protein
MQPFLDPMPIPLPLISVLFDFGVEGPYTVSFFERVRSSRRLIVLTNSYRVDEGMASHLDQCKA